MANSINRLLVDTLTATNHIKVDGYTIDLSAGATTNQVLQYNGTSFIAGTVSGGSMAIGNAVTSGTSGSVLFVNSSSQLAQNNTAFFWNDSNKVLKITQSAADPADGTGALTLQNTLSTSISQITWRDHSGTFKAALGLANAGGSGPNYFYADNGGAGMQFQGPGGSSVQLYSGTANQAGIQLWNGSSLGASASSTGRFVYSTTSSTFRASLNGGSYGDVLAGNGLTFNSSTIRIGVGTAASSPAYALDIRDATSGGECVAVRSLSTSGYSDLVWFDSSNAQKGGIGWGNSGVGNTLASRNFFFTPALDWVMSDGTTDYFRWYNGSSAIGFEFAAGTSATASGSSKGKIRYNSTSQLFQVSHNTGSYLDNIAGNLTATRIPFASAAGTLTDDSNLNWDNTNKRLGIGLTSPATVLDLKGSSTDIIKITNSSTSSYSDVIWYDSSNTLKGGIGYANASASLRTSKNFLLTFTDYVITDDTTNFYTLTKASGSHLFTQPVNTSGTPIGLQFTGGAHTGLAASTDTNDILFALNRTVQFSTGALSAQRAVYIRKPTYAFVGASTITNAATLDIEGAPVAGTNATITNSWALRVEAGNTYHGGDTFHQTFNPTGVGGNITSASTIAPTNQIHMILATNAIDTITVPTSLNLATWGGVIYLIPNAAFTWTTAGNIALAGTAVTFKMLTMLWSSPHGKWYPSYT